VLTYDDLTHGFISLPGVVDSADRALTEISTAIRANLVN
jgi:hypothetical protein